MPQISEEQAQALRVFTEGKVSVVNLPDSHGTNGHRIIGLRVPTNLCGGHGMSDLMIMFELALGIHPSQKD